MVRITPELLRKRSEHNEGQLSNLEEISLHQFDIERIEHLDKYCKHLRIIYLQNNIIPRMENLNRLKELEYLNLALNNISLIENIERCESLKKLDLTLNFIELKDLEMSLSNLKPVESLEQLYLTGNPCTDWEHFRQFAVAMLPQLHQLDGKDITHTERLSALQELPRLLGLLEEELQSTEESQRGFTKETKLEIARENERVEKEKEEQRKKTDEEYYGIKEPEPASLYNNKGEIRQCNQGGYKFDIYEQNEKTTQYIVLELFVPKYLDTSQIDVDLNPTYVRVNIKNKITQLTFACEVKVEDSKAMRSQTTGALQLKMPKVKPTLVPFYQLKEEKPPKAPKTHKSPHEPQGAKQNSLKTEEEKKPEAEDWEDDPEVPPLE